MAQSSYKLPHILARVVNCTREQVTGRLDIRSSRDRRWSLYFSSGRPTWGIGGEHQLRRWRRHYARHVTRGDFSRYPVESTIRNGDRYECWDYHLLVVLNLRQQIDTEGLRAIHQGILEEVLFDIFQEGSAWFLNLQASSTSNPEALTFTVTWQEKSRPSEQVAIPLSWTTPTNDLLNATRRNWEAWKQSGFGNYSPDLAPSLRRPEILTSNAIAAPERPLLEQVDGQLTLRDLAARQLESVLNATRVLMPHVREGSLSLGPVADLPAAPKPESDAKASQPQQERRQGQKTLATATATANRLAPLIALIDDSSQVRQVVQRILLQGGYRFLGIDDPRLALPVLIEKKPELIFVDLVMPEIGGYELCTQIRQTSALRDTPVVIVTSNDSIVDRMRAKMVGANGFLSKPVERVDLLLAAQKYVQPQEARS